MKNNQDNDQFPYLGISPDCGQDETKSTLLFGSRAKTIKNVVSANVEFSAAEWQKKYNKLENKLAAIREMTQKLIEEARNCRKGKETPEKDQVNLEMEKNESFQLLVDHNS